MRKVTLIIESAATSSSSPLCSLSAAANSPSSSLSPMTSLSSVMFCRFRFFFDIDAVAYGSGHDDLLYERVNIPFTWQRDSPALSHSIITNAAIITINSTRHTCTIKGQYTDQSKNIQNKSKIKITQPTNKKSVHTVTRNVCGIGWPCM